MALLAKNNTYKFVLEFINGGFNTARVVNSAGEWFSEYGEMSYKEITITSGFDLMSFDFARKLAESVYIDCAFTHDQERVFDSIYFDGVKATFSRSGWQKPEYEILEGIEYVPSFKFKKTFIGTYPSPYDHCDGEGIDIHLYDLH